jgi:sphinganine C4-monooxygenase
MTSVSSDRSSALTWHLDTMSWKDESPIYHPEFAETLVPSNRAFPFYYNEHPSILPGVTDKTLSVIAPLVAYWALSLVFHALDTWGANSTWLGRYRIHESAEVRSKNLVSKWHVVGAVLLQQAIQTLLGVFWVDAEDSALTDHTAKMSRMSPILVQSTLLWTGNPQMAISHLRAWGSLVLHFIYWWAIPTFQIFFAL